MVKTVTKEGGEREIAAEEVRESLKILESSLGENQPFFGGEAFGFVDIAAGWLGLWARIIGEVSDVVLIAPQTMPLLCAWFDRCLEFPIYKESLPPRDELLRYITKLPQTLSARSS
jgi:glutathione S-transferase